MKAAASSPSLALRESITPSSSKNSTAAAGRKFNRNTVGPTMKTNTASRPASTMLMFDSSRMPRLMPETAEMMNSAARIAMALMRNVFPTGPMPVTTSNPRPIWSTPMPREMAVPKSVTMMAKTSMVAPRGPAVRLPKMGSKIAEMRGARPRR